MWSMRFEKKESSLVATSLLRWILSRDLRTIRAGSLWRNRRFCFGAKASGRPDEAAARTSVDYVLANDRLWLWPSPIWCILWLSWIWFLGEGMSAHNSNSIIRFFHACYWESERSTQHKSRLFIGNGWNRLANKFVYLLEEPIDKFKKEACRIRAGFFGWFIWLELFTEKVQPVLFVFLFRLYFFSLFAREFFSQLTDRVSNGGFWSLL